MIRIVILFASLEPSERWLLVSALEGAAWPLGLDTDSERAKEDMEGIVRAALGLNLYVAITASGLWIVYTFLELFPYRSMAAWLLMANFYGYMMIFDYGSSAHLFHGLYLAAVALTALNLGLRARRRVGELLVRYWIVLAFLAPLVWPPGLGLRTLEPPLGAGDKDIVVDAGF